MKSPALGVVVVRVQVPELHSGHHYLLNAVTSIHSRVLVLVGETEARLTPDDPLTYGMRAEMIRGAYPDVEIAKLKDQPSDVAWSRNLDNTVYEFVAEGDPAPVLYGGRDSFLKHYSGSIRTFELPPAEPISGTEIRDEVKPEDSADFRRGMIYAAKYRFPVSYQCVDIAVVANFPHSGPSLLLGQKARDNGKWRFPGGFVSTADKSLEDAVRRELREETQLEAGDIRYIGSEQIKDFRYPESGTDRLMTAFFLVSYKFGTPMASDDLERVQWFDLHDPTLKSQIEVGHHSLYDKLHERLQLLKGTDAVR